MVYSSAVCTELTETN